MTVTIYGSALIISASISGLTSFIRFPDGQRFVDLEPHRNVEIEALLKSDNASPQVFKTQQDYYEYLMDPNLPVLPWYNKNDMLKISIGVLLEIRRLSRRRAQQLSAENSSQLPKSISS